MTDKSLHEKTLSELETIKTQPFGEIDYDEFEKDFPEAKGLREDTGLISIKDLKLWAAAIVREDERRKAELSEKIEMLKCPEEKDRAVAYCDEINELIHHNTLLRRIFELVEDLNVTKS